MAAPPWLWRPPVWPLTVPAAGTFPSQQAQSRTGVCGWEGVLGALSLGLLHPGKGWGLRERPRKEESIFTSLPQRNRDAAQRPSLSAAVIPRESHVFGKLDPCWTCSEALSPQGGSQGDPASGVRQTSLSQEWGRGAPSADPSGPSANGYNLCWPVKGEGSSCRKAVGWDQARGADERGAF